METAAGLECDYKCGSPSFLPFHYKMKHNDKISKCTCGDNILSGICLNKARSKVRGIASKCSSSSSSFNPNGEGASDPGIPTGAKPHSNSNLRSSWGTKSEAPFTDSVSNSNSSSNSSPTSNSSFTSNSNPF